MPCVCDLWVAAGWFRSVAMSERVRGCAALERNGASQSWAPHRHCRCRSGHVPVSNYS
jgi:hypothetical protein